MTLPSAEDFAIDMEKLTSSAECLLYMTAGIRARDAAVLEAVAEMIDEERENTYAGQPYFVLLAKRVRAMKGA